MNIRQLNEHIAIAAFYPEISEITLNKVQAFKREIELHPFEGLLEIWSSYHSIAVAFDPEQITFDEVKDQLHSLPILPTKKQKKTSENPLEIPIQYHQNTPDVLALSTSLDLPVKEIIAIHSAVIYQVAMLGFQPGFPFLIGLPAKLHHPRKKSPSLRVPKGSVAIGGAQTGIYPSESPGGWHVIGHTPLDLFTRPDQFLLKPGDYVKFVAL